MQLVLKQQNRWAYIKTKMNISEHLQLVFEETKKLVISLQLVSVTVGKAMWQATQKKQ